MTVCAPTVVTSLGSRGTLPHQASVNLAGMPVPQSVMNARRATVSEQRTIVWYKDGPVSNGALGRYINDLFDHGIGTVVIVDGPPPTREETEGEG